MLLRSSWVDQAGIDDRDPPKLVNRDGFRRLWWRGGAGAEAEARAGLDEFDGGFGRPPLAGIGLGQDETTAPYSRKAS
jgi:hypothetical protein